MGKNMAFFYPCWCAFLWFILSFFLIVCLSVTVKWLSVKTASEMTYTVSGGALNPTQSNQTWLGGVVVSVSDSRSRGRGFDSRPVHRQATTLGKLLTPMCLCHQAVQFGTGQRAVMLCSREGNRRSGVGLAMRHRLQWFIHLRAHGQGKADEHPTYAHSGMVHFFDPI